MAASPGSVTADAAMAPAPAPAPAPTSKRARKRRVVGGIENMSDFQKKHPALFALLPAPAELPGFNMTTVYTTEDFKVGRRPRRNLFFVGVCQLPAYFFPVLVV